MWVRKRTDGKDCLVPYKDPERQRAAVRRHKIESRLGPNPSLEALLEAEVRIQGDYTAAGDCGFVHRARSAAKNTLGLGVSACRDTSKHD